MAADTVYEALVEHFSLADAVDLAFVPVVVDVADGGDSPWNK